MTEATNFRRTRSTEWIRTLLLDDAAEANWLQEFRGRRVLRLSSDDSKAAEHWMAEQLARRELRGLAAEWIAGRLGVEPGLIIELSPPLYRDYLDRTLRVCEVAYLNDRPQQSAQRVRSETESESILRIARFCAGVLGWTAPSLESLLSQIASVAALSPPDSLPVFLYTARHPVCATVRLADEFADIGIPVGLRIEPRLWNLFLNENPFVRHALRWRSPEFDNQFDNHKESGSEDDQTERFLQQYAPDALGTLSAIQAMVVQQQDQSEPLNDEARSSVERLLFSVLNARALTRGRFQLNASLPFTFGTTQMECDFADFENKVALEIDGYYHFRDLTAYRRDRKKDALLQEYGWLVRRFLAEDVVFRLEDVIAEIEHTLARKIRHHF